MSNEIENEIQESLVKDKIKNFLIRNKLKIITASIICIILLYILEICSSDTLILNSLIILTYFIINNYKNYYIHFKYYL